MEEITRKEDSTSKKPLVSGKNQYPGKFRGDIGKAGMWMLQFRECGWFFISLTLSLA
jgi:hypothetical protein